MHRESAVTGTTVSAVLIASGAPGRGLRAIPVEVALLMLPAGALTSRNSSGASSVHPSKMATAAATAESAATRGLSTLRPTKTPFAGAVTGGERATIRRLELI